MPIYEKPVRQLMRDMVSDLGIRQGEPIAREQILDWFRTRYPLVKEGTVSAHLIRMSANNPGRLHHRLRPDGSDDLFFHLDSGLVRLYDSDSDPPPITVSSPGKVEEADFAATASSFPESSQFAYEHDLRDFLARNLEKIEPGLRLYDDDGITGIEFPAGGRFIDILARDRSGGYVVIELKVSKGYDRALGQLLRYLGWIEKHHADPGSTVRGVIVAREISEDLKLACARVPGVLLFEYQLAVTLHSVQP
jgi:endonuclease